MPARIGRPPRNLSAAVGTIRALEGFFFYSALGYDERVRQRAAARRPARARHIAADYAARRHSTACGREGAVQALAVRPAEAAPVMVSVAPVSGSVTAAVQLHGRVYNGRGRLARSLLRCAYSHRHRRRSHAVVHRRRVRQLVELTARLAWAC